MLHALRAGGLRPLRDWNEEEEYECTEEIICPG